MYVSSVDAVQTAMLSLLDKKSGENENRTSYKPITSINNKSLPKVKDFAHA